MHTATPSFLSITRRAALRWRKARTYLGIPGYACETTGSARRQPDHIHMGRLTHLQTENISVLVRREPVPHWYAAQSQKTDALPLSHGGSCRKIILISHFRVTSFWGSVLLPQDTPRHPRTPQDGLLYLKDTSKYLCLFIFIIILLI